MHLQWFPGHMTKALRMMEEEVKLCDGIIMVLDARAPFACLNKKLSSVFGNKPVVYAINKTDLVSEKDVKTVVETFSKQGKIAVPVIGTSEKSAVKLYNAIVSSLSSVLEKYKSKGIKKPLRVMVAGIPNTGKSTLINLLCGNKRAKTGDKAGVTKNKQWVKIKELELLDTPGTTPPSFENQTYAEYLAFIGSINDDIVDFIELSIDLIKYLQKEYKGVLSSIYGVNEDDEPANVFYQIASRRGALKKGGEIDEERASNLIISDLRKGKIGKIYFK
ncbi:MAG: ribosome biogenesis GTPase YlqF [Clostridiales bacterium]|nr:ribosome biogenesis GTPase YlqF [Clostridiales bacterium]